MKMIRVSKTVYHLIFAVGLLFQFSKSVTASDVVRDIGVIEVVSNHSFDQAYTLQRGDMNIEIHSRRMSVKNGDIIEPRNEAALRLTYAFTSCGSENIRGKTKVWCSPAGHFADSGVVEHIFNPIRDMFLDKLKRKKLQRTQSLTLRSGQAFDCFPSAEFVLSPLPMNKSNFIQSSNIFFRWNGEEHGQINSPSECTSAELVVSAQSKKSQDVTVLSVKIGELIKLQEQLRNGEEYQWYIRKDGKRISEIYTFSLAHEKEVSALKEQLYSIAKLVDVGDANLAKALYLQDMSEYFPEHNFVSNSIYYLMEYKAGIVAADSILREDLYDYAIDNLTKRIYLYR